MVFMNGCYLLSVDGASHFSSNTVHYDSCSMKKNSNRGNYILSSDVGCGDRSPGLQIGNTIGTEPITIWLIGRSNLPVGYSNPFGRSWEVKEVSGGR